MSHRQQRTAAEAIVQAEAKYRIVTAHGVRALGLGIAALGGTFLTRPSYWSAYKRIVEVRFPGVPPVHVSGEVIFGALALAVGAGVMITGSWLLRRAVAAARNDPIADDIFDQPSPPELE